MPRETRKWHPRFIRYMDKIVKHPNYQGLRITKKADGSYNWIATEESEIGKDRMAWCIAKAYQLGIEIKPGFRADVMLAVHPTKWKVCQTCGREMSLYYHYPNANFVKSLNREFNSDFTDCDHISDIWDELMAKGIDRQKIAQFLIRKGGLSLDCSADKDDIIEALEYQCRKGGKKCLGPGAMSNFPDRYDGFHTYNRCCRATQDKGRSKENMKTYTRDRRAYEYWSDGNIHAANQFMGSSFFDGISADHIGSISLGFVHDPRYLQPMGSGENSSKRDRLQLGDIESIIEVESRTGIYPMSWYSKIIWEHIRANYSSNIPKIAGVYRDALKQNMANFMYILWTVLEQCPNNGEEFLVEAFLKPKFEYFEYSYSFNELGEIIKKAPRHHTERSKYEMARYQRIAIEAVYDYMEKDNRNVSPNLTANEKDVLSKICNRINTHLDINSAKSQLQELLALIQRRIVSFL